MQCGRLECGFLELACRQCGHSQLVARSLRRRAKKLRGLGSISLAAPASLAARSAPRAQAARHVAGAVVGEQLDSINGVAASAPKSRTHELWSWVVSANRGSAGAAARSTSQAEPIRKLWLDGLRKPTLDLSVPQIGAPLLWNLGYEGDGILVAVLDTGIDQTHPDLSDKVIVSRNFTEVADIDEVGHGTHVASIIAGSGAAQGGLYRGVAPGVQLLSGKVCESESSWHRIRC